MKSISILILGGDMRNVYLSSILSECGYIVKSITNSYDNSISFKDFDIVIGPTPCSKDNETFFAPMLDKSINILDVFKELGSNQLFIAGGVSEKVIELGSNENVTLVDYLELDDVAIANGIATAEGAIVKAMECSNITLHGSKSVVLGFGRCGKVLAHKLRGLDSLVSVSYRRMMDCSLINAYGYSSVSWNSISEKIGEFDFIFNTIPKPILDSNLLSIIKKSCVIIDLASNPGGTDFDVAKALGISAHLCPGIPGKVAPLTSAHIMKDAILNIINERKCFK